MKEPVHPSDKHTHPEHIPTGRQVGGREWVRHGMAWHGMAWHGMAWHGMAWHGMAWNGSPWHGMAVHGFRVPWSILSRTMAVYGSPLLLGRISFIHHSKRVWPAPLHLMFMKLGNSHTLKNKSETPREIITRMQGHHWCVLYSTWAWALKLMLFEIIHTKISSLHK